MGLLKCAYVSTDLGDTQPGACGFPAALFLVLSRMERQWGPVICIGAHGNWICWLDMLADCVTGKEVLSCSPHPLWCGCSWLSSALTAQTGAMWATWLLYIQGSHGHRNPWKVMEFLNPIFQDWKSHEIQEGHWKFWKMNDIWIWRLKKLIILLSCSSIDNVSRCGFLQHDSVSNWIDIAKLGYYKMNGKGCCLSFMQ